MKYKPPPKRKKVDEPPASSESCIPASSPLVTRDDVVQNLINRSSAQDTHARGSVNVGTEPGRSSVVNQAMQHSSVDIRIQQARNLAVVQAQQDGCKGNYKVFDSVFGNYLVPVIPTRAELVCLETKD